MTALEICGGLWWPLLLCRLEFMETMIENKLPTNCGRRKLISNWAKWNVHVALKSARHSPNMGVLAIFRQEGRSQAYLRPIYIPSIHQLRYNPRRIRAFLATIYHDRGHPTSSSVCIVSLDSPLVHPSTSHEEDTLVPRTLRPLRWFWCVGNGNDARFPITRLI